MSSKRLRFYIIGTVLDAFLIYQAVEAHDAVMWLITVVSTGLWAWFAFRLMRRSHGLGRGRNDAA